MSQRIAVSILNRWVQPRVLCLRKMRRGWKGMAVVSLPAGTNLRPGCGVRMLQGVVSVVIS